MGTIVEPPLVITSRSVSKSGAPLGRSAHRMSKWSDIVYRLRRSCFDSLLSLLVEEIGRSVLRIGALLREKPLYSRRALVVPILPPEMSQFSFVQESEYLHICTEDIQRLLRENRWAGHLDQRIMIEAYLAGSSQALRICNTRCDGS